MAPVLEQTFHERALLEGSGGGERHYHHLGLGLGLGRRGEDGALPVRAVQEDLSSGSSGESVYFSASSDDNNDGDNDFGGDGGSDDVSGERQRNHSGGQAQDGPVSSRTRSRHGVSGGLVAMMDAAVDCRVDGEEQHSDGIGGRQLYSRQVRQDGDFLERERLH